MRFDVKHHVSISNAAMLGLTAAHVTLAWLTILGVKAFLEASASAKKNLPENLWDTPFYDYAAWIIPETLGYVTFAVCFANGVAPTLIVGQWMKTKGWPMPALGMALFAAVHINVWQYWLLTSLLERR